MNRAELDVGGYRHKSIWDNMADQYNNNTGKPAAGVSDGNKGDNSYLDVIQTPHMLYELENPEDFDCLDGRDVAQFIRWITHQYYVTHKSVSGDHARFEDRVGSKSYLLYFHNMVTATGAENIESLMKAELSRDVFAESSVPGLPAATAQLQETMHGFHTPRAKRFKHKGSLLTSNSKEETDNAILRFLSTSERNTAESDIASASSTAAKDEYIREKKRMAVEAFDVTMVASMSDAVDTSLKKWRVALKELSDLAADKEFGVNHPIYIATEATVKLYEATFHTLVAQANRVHGSSVTSLEAPVRTNQYVFGNMCNELEEGDCYSRDYLFNSHAHRNGHGNISGNKEIGCPSLIVCKLARACDEDKFPFLTYVVGDHSHPKALLRSFVKQQPVRVFRSSKGNRMKSNYFPDSDGKKVLYRYDGVYYIVAAVNKEDGAVKSLGDHVADARVFYLIRAEPLSFMRNLMDDNPFLEYFLPLPTTFQTEDNHAYFSVKGSKDLIGRAWDVNGFHDWNPRTVRV
ncbi:SAD/SRA domain [Fragilaria crotonensis]|nr:SAD/SRA domain [Fragilaria crotonensis]